jgi:hypothetical protein
MSSNTRISPVPLVAGILLFTGAVALLCEDAWHGHVQLNHLLQPLLMAGTIVAGVMAHHRLAQWKISGLAFLALALLGSSAVIYATLSRTATARDAQQSAAMAENRTLALKDDELIAAKASAKLECRKMGPLCEKWNARVDQLTREMAPLRAVAVDPRADALGRLADLVGLDAKRTRAIVSALDPVILPLFLELGCILFFAAAFPHRRLQTATDRKCEASVDASEVQVPRNQREWAQVWGVHESTASRRIRKLAGC